MKIAIIGCGYWGTHLLRNFNQSEFWDLVGACDLDENQIKKVKNNYPNLYTTNSIDDILNIQGLDAIVISTPVFSHFEIAEKSLKKGINTWIEKPMTSNSEDAQKLIDLSIENNCIINIDHTYIYTPAVRKIKELITNGELGEILYYDSIRINLGLFQHDVNVIWDLAPHDISILNYLIDKKPTAVSATGSSVIKYNEKNLESIAYITIYYEDNTLAHLNVNWLSPLKIRQIIIGGSNKMLVFDDMAVSEKIKVYDTGVKLTNREDIYETLVQYRIGDMYSPALPNKEALKEEVDHFYNCIKNKKNTDTDAHSGLLVVQIIEAANKSLINGGAKIEL